LGQSEARELGLKLKEGISPAPFNTQPLTNMIAAAFTERFSQDRWKLQRAQMGGEDFSQLYLADKENIQSLLFWVGGVPQAKWDAAGGDVTKLPSIHSPFWAPDAQVTI